MTRFILKAYPDALL